MQGSFPAKCLQRDRPGFRWWGLPCSNEGESLGKAAATIRTIFTQPTAGLVRTQLDTVADMLGTQFPKVKAMLLAAKEDLTAFADFPPRHWKKIQ